MLFNYINKLIDEMERKKNGHIEEELNIFNVALSTLGSDGTDLEPYSKGHTSKPGDQNGNNHETKHEDNIPSAEIYHYSTSSWVDFFLISILQLILFFTYLRSPCHYSVRFNGNSYNSKSLIFGLTEVLKTISYFAIDLSVTLNVVKPILDISYLDTIDTFSENNFYTFHPYIFCKNNFATKKSYCLERHGLDIVGSLIGDVGFQLALVSKAQQPNDISKSFNTAYTHAISIIKTLHEKQEIIDSGLKKENNMYKIACNLSLSIVYADIVAKTSYAIIILHLGITFIQASQIIKSKMKGIAAKTQYSSKAYRALVCLVLINFLLTFMNWILEVYYYRQIIRMGKTLEALDLKFGYGFVLLSSSVVIYNLFFYLLILFR